MVYSRVWTAPRSTAVFGMQEVGLNSFNDRAESVVGTYFGASQRYRVLRQVGSGGMGEVFLAEDTVLPRHVALKTIKPRLAGDEELRKRIERECRLHAKIGTHPHIVTLYDRIEADGQICLIMEYVDGGTFQDMLQIHARQTRRPPWRDGVRIILQILDALARIHALGIVHRDIKPENILITRDERSRICAKLLDFGIARLQDPLDRSTNVTRDGASGPGTPLYMAPEQIDSRHFGSPCPATDTYAMGVILYQILAGKPPFEGTLTEVFAGHLSAPVPVIEQSDPDVPATLFTVLHKALSKQPLDRFSNASEFYDALVETQRLDELAVTATYQPTGGAAATLVDTGEDLHGYRTGQTQLSASGTNTRARRGGVVPLAVGIAIAGIAVVGSAYYVAKFGSSASNDAAFEAPPHASVSDNPSAGAASEEPTPSVPLDNSSASPDPSSEGSAETSGQDLVSTVTPPPSNNQADAASEPLTSEPVPEVEEPSGDTAQRMLQNLRGSKSPPPPGEGPQPPDPPVLQRVDAQSPDSQTKADETPPVPPKKEPKRPAEPLVNKAAKQAAEAAAARARQAAQEARARFTAKSQRPGADYNATSQLLDRADQLSRSGEFEQAGALYERAASSFSQMGPEDIEIIPSEPVIK